jgi:DEAD/DEAH box helicase domain-containing protein
MNDYASQLVQNLNLEVVEALELPGRPERRLSLPNEIKIGPLARTLDKWAPDGQLWHHQTLALQALFDLHNIVVSTGTASGKSLIFQLRAFDLILRDRDTKVLVFYPLKALASDQLARWQRMALDLGLSQECVARIDGDIPTTERAGFLANANIVLMTPDVCQAWLMRNVGTAGIRRFFDKLALLVLDEAHIYESVFGSNVAFLLRRMIGAKRRSSQNIKDRRFQIIATTATIKDPAQHLSALTGVDFKVVDEAENDAPFYPRRIFHVNGPEYGAGGGVRPRSPI